jgi:YfiR/HmsC-like
MDILKSPWRSMRCRFALQTGGWLLFALAVGGLFPSVVGAQSYRPSTDEVMAKFLFNLTKFVEWPDSSFDDAQEPIIFGLLGGDAWLGFDLRYIAAAEKVHGRSIVIRNQHFRDDLRRCHVLFVSASERQHILQILASLQAPMY